MPNAAAAHVSLELGLRGPSSVASSACAAAGHDPVPVPNPAERSLRMAVAMRDRVGELLDKWRKRGYDLDFGVGIAQGYASIGAIGFEDRWKPGPAKS